MYRCGCREGRNYLRLMRCYADGARARCIAHAGHFYAFFICDLNLRPPRNILKHAAFALEPKSSEVGFLLSTGSHEHYAEDRVEGLHTVQGCSAEHQGLPGSIRVLGQ